jgi:acyl carrier protein
MSTISEPTFAQLAFIIEDKLGIPSDHVVPGTTLSEIEVDSLALIEVALIAEEQFGAEIPTDKVSSSDTVQDLYELIVAAVRESRQDA